MNTAGRLLSIYDKLTGTGWPQDKTMVWVWAEVFGLAQTSPHIEDDVVACLQAMRSEIDLLRTKLLSMGVTEDLLHPGLPRFRNVTSPVFLNAQWTSIRDEPSRPENRIFLIWANWALRSEDETEVPDGDLSALREQLDSLETALQDAKISQHLHSFVQRQVDTIRTALRIYRVQGIAPIKAALNQVAGACAIEGRHIDAENESEPELAKNVLSRTAALIKKTAEVADQLDKIGKAGMSAYSLAAGVSPLLLSFSQSLGS